MENLCTVETIEEKVLYEGYTSKIEIHKYWDSHGKMMSWGCDTNNYNQPAHIKIVSKTKVYHWKFTPDTTFEFWSLTINGETISEDITEYKILKSKVVIHACAGAG